MAAINVRRGSRPVYSLLMSFIIFPLTSRALFLLVNIDYQVHSISWARDEPHSLVLSLLFARCYSSLARNSSRLFPPPDVSLTFEARSKKGTVHSTWYMRACNWNRWWVRSHWNISDRRDLAEVLIGARTNPSIERRDNGIHGEFFLRETSERTSGLLTERAQACEGP